MAILSAAPTTGQIGALRGIVDIYKWKTLWVARAWPRAPLHPKTQSQRDTWNSFQLMMNYRKGMPAHWRELWREINPPLWRRTEDLIRSELKILSNHGLIDSYPAIETAAGSYVAGAETQTLEMFDPAAAEVLAGRLVVCYKTIPMPPEPMIYVRQAVDAGYRRAYVPRYRPDYNGFKRKTFSFDPAQPTRLSCELPAYSEWIQAYLSLDFREQYFHMLTPPFYVQFKKV